ncbi:hypothetical protein LCGC14_1788940 [marine sediment metagenome]|uniref:C2H2-type domain-containing protein n=1 Tax=marine sediment metagenome TaxID=412755 RepID=A0A0F9JSQ1_9ZZZZ
MITFVCKWCGKEWRELLAFELHCTILHSQSWLIKRR